LYLNQLTLLIAREEVLPEELSMSMHMELVNVYDEVNWVLGE
jgi:hypothetical protein